MKRLAIPLISLTVLTGPAFAAPPASQDACLEQAFALAEKAQGKKLAKAAQEKVESLLSGLETKCTSGDMAGAEAAIKGVEAAIEGK
jgi:hypothetical protein